MFEYREAHIGQKEKTLRDFIPLVITFFVGLTVLSIYQNTLLYSMGILDSILNTSFLLYLLHHLGFASASALFLAFIFNILENKRPGLGLKTVKIILLLMLFVETSLITYYLQNFEPLGSDLVGLFKNKEFHFSISQTLVVYLATLIICFFSYKYIASLYKVISRMYPLTIIFFSIFLATLYSDKNPINENKTQHLAQHLTKRLLRSKSYDGKEEYPLLKSFDKETGLSQYFQKMDSLPNIKFIIVDGMGNDFVNGKYQDFMPHLKELKTKSLNWVNFLSNTGESYAALPTIVGSLPFGEAGFTKIPDFTYRNTLYSVLKNNGYVTTFNYGGNTALHNFDRFLEEEKVTTIFDRNNFGKEYKLQEEDAAGITLGYPDKALFSNYENNIKSTITPKFDVFVTLSTKAPFQIPEKEIYKDRVAKIVDNSNFEGSTKRFIRRNDELFSSFIYTDDALGEFFSKEKTLSTYANTIYIITGSHKLAEIPKENALSKYKVPFFIYSPLLKSTGNIEKISCHADIAPSMLALLSKKPSFKVPNRTAWLGEDLISSTTITESRQIPLLRNAYNIQDYILNDLFFTDGDIYRLDKQLNLHETNGEDEEKMSRIENRFENFKAINRYVTNKNRIVPQSLSLVADKQPKFSKEETIWIQSVFNGKDFDDAYSKAKNMAFDKDYGRALLLCEYILSKIPRHADTEILMGRIYSWKENYGKSIDILSEVVKKYPKYEDGYCALMDAFFWSGQNEMAYDIQRAAKKNNVNDKILEEKFERSISFLLREKKKDPNPVEEQKTAEVSSQK